MTLYEFVSDLTSEAANTVIRKRKETKLGDLPVVFNTGSRFGLYYLSIYEHNGEVNIDIGEEGE